MSVARAGYPRRAQAHLFLKKHRRRK